MILEYSLHNKRASLPRLLLLTAIVGLASAARAYDANHDDKLEPPTPEQTERALEAGERFQYQLIPPPLARPPMTTIPESYTARTEPERVLAEPWDPYDYYLWRWGPRAFWPCEQYDPFRRFSSHLYSVPPWKDEKHDRDNDHWWGSFDMWCPPTYGPISTHPRRWGEPW